jgi:hypothetical protein
LEDSSRLILIRPFGFHLLDFSIVISTEQARQVSSTPNLEHLLSITYILCDTFHWRQCQSRPLAAEAPVHIQVRPGGIYEGDIDTGAGSCTVSLDSPANYGSDNVTYYLSSGTGITDLFEATVPRGY